MGIYSKKISELEIEINIFEIKRQLFDNGACQCFKDCDCYQKKGESLGESSQFYHKNIVWEVTNKPRKFNSLSALKESLSHRLKSGKMICN